MQPGDRVTWSQEGITSLRPSNPKQVGTVVGRGPHSHPHGKNYITSVLWDGRKTVTSIACDFLSVIKTNKGGIMNRYDLTVRGETVHLEFKRINDSRRLRSYHTDKAPNLFGVRSALVCEVVIPASMAPGWWKEKDNHEYQHFGTAFCTHRDKWSSLAGRHIALGDALNYFGHDDALNAEITEAFTAEEKRRAAAPKGLARQPKTAKPKPLRPGMRQVLDRLCDLLERMEANKFAALDRAIGGAPLAEEFHQQVERMLESFPVPEKFRPAESDMMEPMAHGIAPMIDTDTVENK